MNSGYYKQGKLKIHVQVSLDDEIVESHDVCERVAQVMIEVLEAREENKRVPIRLAFLACEMLDDVCDIWLEAEQDSCE